VFCLDLPFCVVRTRNAVLGWGTQDQNLELIKQALERAPRWAIKKLTGTYLTPGVPEIGGAVGIEEVEEVRRVMLSTVRTRAYSAIGC